MASSLGAKTHTLFRLSLDHSTTFSASGVTPIIPTPPQRAVISLGVARRLVTGGATSPGAIVLIRTLLKAKDNSANAEIIVHVSGRAKKFSQPTRISCPDMAPISGQGCGNALRSVWTICDEKTNERRMRKIKNLPPRQEIANVTETLDWSFCNERTI